MCAHVLFDIPEDPTRCSIDGWRVDATSVDDWELGKSTLVGSTSCMFGTLLEDDYNRNRGSYLFSPTLNLTPCTGNTVSLVWNMWLRTNDSGDRLSVYISSDGGDNWSQVGGNYSTTDTSWGSYSLNISAYLSDELLVAFYFRSDNDSSQDRGVYVDNIRFEVN